MVVKIARCKFSIEGHSEVVELVLDEGFEVIVVVVVDLLSIIFCGYANVLGRFHTAFDFDGFGPGFDDVFDVVDHAEIFGGEEIFTAVVGFSA